MEPLFEHRRRFAGYETRVLELEGSGPPLVLMHGWSDSADTWRHALAELGRRERRAIAVDLPGFGDADRLRPGAVLEQYDRFGSELLAYAREEGGEPVAVGNSLGGCVALRLAEREPLEGVVAVAPAGLDMAGWLALVERDPAIRRLLALPLPVPGRAVREVVARAYVALAFARPDRVDPRVARAFASHHGSREAVASYLDIGHRLLPELRDPFELEAVRAPVLLVWGTEDRLVFRTGAERVLATVPGSRLEVLDGCGHCPQIEEADRFAELLIGFAEAGARSAA